MYFGLTTIWIYKILSLKSDKIILRVFWLSQPIIYLKMFFNIIPCQISFKYQLVYLEIWNSAQNPENFSCFLAGRIEPLSFWTVLLDPLKPGFTFIYSPYLQRACSSNSALQSPTVFTVNYAIILKNPPHNHPPSSA
jgi:hypothetical protein